MANINRDYLIVLDAKSSVISEADELKYYITDEHSQNLFVNLVVRDIERINKYVEVHDPEKYQLELHIVKPNNDIVRPHLQASLLSAEDALYEFELPKEAVDYIGTYKCELRVTYQESEEKTITTSNKFKYRVKRSIYNDLDSIQDAPKYPVVIQLFDKLSDINQYEEDRRANELVRQLAEQQRQQRFNELDTNMVHRITSMDNKITDVEDRVQAKEQAVDKLIVDTKKDIDDYKVAKNTEINEYKTAKDQQIDQAITNQNNKIDDAIANQNNKIDTAVAEQNNRIEIVEASDNTQNTRLDALEAKDIAHETSITNIEAKNIEQDNRLDSIEAVNVSQDNRLDAIEIKNQQQDNRLLDIEKVNKRQDMDLKCLFAESKNNMIDVTEEGNSIYLQNSTVGYTLIDEIQGNTMVNCNKEPDKEIILNGNINTRGYSNITLTEGVDGGLVDVALEGNTMVNVCDQKDPVAITKSYTVETGNHVALQGEYDGKCRPIVTGNTLVNIYDMTKIYKINSTINDNIITFDTSSGGTWYVVNNKLPALKTSTKYTIILNIIENTIEDTDDKYLNIEGLSNNSGFTSGDTSLPKGFTGIYKVALTTKDEFTANYLSDIRLIKNSGYTGKISFSVCILEGDYTNKPIPDYFTGMQSSFEDKVVTQEMVDNGEEVAENLGKYKVDYVISKEDGTVGQTKTFYLNSPLLEGDTIEQRGDNVVHVHRSELRAYETDDELTLPTDMTNTLVAKAIPRYEVISQSDTILCDSYVNGHLDVDSVIPIEKVDFLPFTDELTYLYASTQYAVQFVSNAVNKVDITLGGAKLLNQDVVVGTNKYMITTPSELINNNLILNGQGFNASNIVVTEATDQDFGYFEGMKSVGECEGNKIEILSGNKNLFDTDDITYNTYYGVTTSIQNNKVILNGTCNRGVDLWTPFKLPKSIKLYKNKTYKISHSYDNTFYVYSKDSQIKIETYTSVTLTQDIEITHIQMKWANGNSFDNLVIDVQLEEGDTPTDYIPHAHNTQTLTHEPLRAVGDIKDKYVLIDGKWYIERSCGVRAYQEGDIDNYITDMINTVYPLSISTYEPIEYNPFTVYSDITHISNNSTIPCNMIIKNHGYNCLLKPSTTYTVSSNLGLNTVTTPSTLTEDCLRFMDTDTSNVTTMKNVMVLEGDYTTNGKPIPSHFSGIESAFEQEYDEAVGKYKVKIRVQNEDASKENYIEFYIGEPLRGIGDVKDKVYVKNDKVVVERNCCSYTFDGGDDENWVDCGKNNGGVYRYAISQSGCKKQVEGMCDRFIYEKNITANTNYECAGVHSTNDYIVICVKNKTLVELMQYLSENPTTVVYQLAEPTYEEVEYNDVKLFIESFKNSTLFYNSNIPVTSKLWYSYSVPIVDTVAQTANVTDQQDSMIIDLATQVAVMEMMVM